MERKIARNIQKGKLRHKLFSDKSVKRFWDNATRAEHVNPKGKKNK